MFICKYCNKEFETKEKLGGHVSFCNCNPNYKENLLKLANSRKNIHYYENKHLHCKYCDKEISNAGCLVLHERACIKNPDAILSKTKLKQLELDSRRDSSGKLHHANTGKHLSEEHKNKIRQSYYRWITEKRDVFLKYSTGQSKCCEFFKERLRKNNIDFLEEYMPYYKERLYRLDIAFPDKMIGIEINGSQHYNSDGSLNENTLAKQKFFEERGWKIIQIYYKDVFKANLSCFEDILKIQERDKFYIKSDFDTLANLKNKKIAEKEKILNNKLLKQEEKYRQRQLIIKNLIENSNIDFSRFGWVDKARKYLKERNELFNKDIFHSIVLYCSDFLKNENVFKHQQGEKNSQYGTCWIHNDKKSISIKKEDLEKYLAEGWIKGRKMKF
jgi:hypothetical protein